LLSRSLGKNSKNYIIPAHHGFESDRHGGVREEARFLSGCRVNILWILPPGSAMFQMATVDLKVLSGKNVILGFFNRR
jgi:hypothetical protein